ncbi:MAG TPA: thiamine ABC transporter substrate-binding protein [Bacillota bacterium]
MPKRILGILLLALIFLNGCNQPKNQKLVVYTYASFPTVIIDQVKKYFNQNFRQQVEFKSFSDTGPLFNELLQEKEKPQADVVVGLDSNYLPKVVAADLLQAYQPPAAAKIRSDLIFDPQYRLIPFDYGYVVFNYDRERLNRIPKSHRDLLDPYYKNKIILTNPLTSSPGQVFLLTTVALFGDPGYLDYWRELKKNLLTITPGWDEAYGMYTGGEAPLVLSYSTSPVYHLINEQTERYQALVLDDAAYAQIEGIGIVKNAAHLKDAQQLVDYLLSPEIQQLIPENQFMYPVRTDLTLPDSFRIAAQAQRLLNLPPTQVAANLERWLAAWEKVINE